MAITKASTRRRPRLLMRFELRARSATGRPGGVALTGAAKVMQQSKERACKGHW